MLVLADWFARHNVDDTVLFIQYVLLFLFRFVQLLTRIKLYNICHSNFFETIVMPNVPNDLISLVLYQAIRCNS